MIPTQGEAVRALIAKWRTRQAWGGWLDGPPKSPYSTGWVAARRRCADDLSALLAVWETQHPQQEEHIHKWDTEAEDPDGDVNWCVECGALWHGDGTITVPSEATQTAAHGEPDYSDHQDTKE